MNLLTVVKILIFCISNFGYWNFINTKIGIHKYFAPSLSIVFQITVLFLAGLLNCLPTVSYLLCFLGIILFIVSLRNYKKRSNKWCQSYMTSTGYLYLFIMVAVVFLILHHQLLTDWDNFTHWGLVVKLMLRENRFPNFKDTLIDFQEYPLGSSVYIYYFCKMTSETEKFQMLAQAYMMLTMIMPVFTYLKKHQVAGFVLTLLFTNFIFVFCIGLNNLMVDTLLPLVGATGYLFWKNKDESDIKSYLIGSSLYMCAMIQIKNSGILFAGIVAISMIRYLIHTKKDVLTGIAAVITPFITLYLWHQHCSYVFNTAAVSSHAMTLANYQSVFGDKTQSQIHLIISEMLRFSVTGLSLYMFLIMLGITILAAYLYCKKWLNDSVHLAVGLLILYILYSAGMLLMYLFSMSAVEAVELASAQRYRRTIFIFCYVLLFAFHLRIFSEINDAKKSIVYFVVASGILIIEAWKPYQGTIENIFTRRDAEFRLPEREWFQQSIDEYHVPEGSSYAVCTKEDDSGYASILVRYLLMSSDGTAGAVNDSKQMDELTKGKQYLFVYDSENEAANKWIQSHYPEQFGNNVIVLKESD